MTALLGSDIRQRLQENDLDKRLVIAPLLEPAEQLRDDQCSIDVRLGFEFCLVSASSYGMIDEFDPETGSESILKTLYGKQYIPLGQGIVIHPHQFILATTLEYIRLPHDLMSYVVGRSTWGRLGLIVATAIGIHPLFAGSLTLELRNLGETPLKLYPGEAIAQLFFHSTQKEKREGVVTDHAVGLSQYSGTVDMVPRRISSGVTHNKLLVLRQRKK